MQGKRPLSLHSVLLYERYLGRPFAGHRDAVSELVGELMGSAIEERHRNNGVSYRKTGRAERIPGFGQPPVAHRMKWLPASMDADSGRDAKT